MEINFIPDKVLKLTSENDLLGTKPYSETIFEIVKNSNGKKNIGLFGSWGSGKSTILSTFEDLIENYNSTTDAKNKLVNKDHRIAYFEFDAWKYSRDDFRRSFLIEISKRFNVKYEEKLQKLLYNETSYEDPEQTKFKLNKLSLPDWVLFLLVAFAFIFYFLPIMDTSKDLKAIISLFAITISLLSKATSTTLNKYKVVVKQNKVVEP